MDRAKKMSETEAKIMDVLWDSDVPMSAAELIQYFARKRGWAWKASTVSTFMAHLTRKGLVQSSRKGHIPYYYPIRTRTEYAQDIAQTVLDTMYGGSVVRFFAALCGDAPLSPEIHAELKAWLDKQEADTNADS